ncbi:MAG: DUF4038 domain-containing protein [Cyanobacteriota bacterium]|nr:DUF4038 domain-containing protein [Cyanobacteriota bacterium]
MVTRDHDLLGGVCQWSLRSAAAVQVRVVELAGVGRWRLPAFWDGGAVWRVRFAPPRPGRYRLESLGRQGQHWELEVEPGQEAPARAAAVGLPPVLRCSTNQRHLVTDNGVPFWWLSDTWWMGLCNRLSDAEFAELAALRRRQGFNVIQLVAGLGPDMPPLDPRGANDGGHPWQADFAGLNPLWFQRAEERILILLRHGLVPCLVGAWGYMLPWMGGRRMAAHWRELVARWGAWPLVWCLAGEAAMPYYTQRRWRRWHSLGLRWGWSRQLRQLRQVDPWQRLITVHPTTNSRSQLLGGGPIDLELLQTGHHGWASLAATGPALQRARRQRPRLPVIVDELNYEGIHPEATAALQRLGVLTALLGGAAGFGYGANGLWQVNRPGAPFGASPQGHHWGGPPWREAAALPGGQQVGLVVRLLAGLPWWRLQPRPPLAATIPGEMWLLLVGWGPAAPKRLHLEGYRRGQRLRGSWWNPRDGAEQALSPRQLVVAAQPSLAVPSPPGPGHWLLWISCCCSSSG